MIRWSRRALADLSDIAAYIAEDNPRAARAWAARLRARLKRAAEMPRAGRQVLAVIEGHRTLASLD